MLILSASYLCLVLRQVIFLAYHQLQRNNMDYLMCIMWKLYFNIFFQNWIQINILSFSLQLFIETNYLFYLLIYFFGIKTFTVVLLLPVKSREERISKILYNQNINTNTWRYFDRWFLLRDPGSEIQTKQWWSLQLFSLKQQLMESNACWNTNNSK